MSGAPIACTAAREAFVAAALTGSAPAPAAAAHVAVCPSCRERLDQLAAATLSGAAEEISCAECRAALPAWADGADRPGTVPPVETSDGASRGTGLTDDVHMRRHLETCPECFAEWQALRDVLAAVAAGNLAPAPHAPRIDLGFLDHDGAADDAEAGSGGASQPPEDATASSTPSRRRLGGILLAAILLVALLLVGLQRSDLAPWRDTEGGIAPTNLSSERDSEEGQLGVTGPSDDAREGADPNAEGSAGARTTGRILGETDSASAGATPSLVARRGDRPTQLAAMRSAGATATARRLVVDGARASATARSAIATSVAASRAAETALALPSATLTPTPTPTPTPTATIAPVVEPPPEPPDSPGIIDICRPSRPGPIEHVLTGTCQRFPALSEYDMWRLTVTERGRWRLSTCGLTDLDTILALYPHGAFDPTDPCSGLLLVNGAPSYSDDDCGRRGVNSVLDLRLDPGNYTLIVVEKSGDATAPYELSVGTDRTQTRCPVLDSPPSTPVPSTTAPPEPQPSSTAPASAGSTPEAPVAPPLATGTATEPAASRG